MQARTLYEALGFRPVLAPAAYASGSAWSTWIKLGESNFRSMVFVTYNGELDADATVEVFQATDSIGTDATELTSITTGKTFANGTDEGRVGLIYVQVEDLTSGYPYVGLRVTTAASDTLTAVAVLGEAREYPVSNVAGDGVAWTAYYTPAT